jgi:hypothetical protein
MRLAGRTCPQASRLEKLRAIRNRSQERPTESAWGQTRLKRCVSIESASRRGADYRPGNPVSRGRAINRLRETFARW